MGRNNKSNTTKKEEARWNTYKVKQINPGNRFDDNNNFTGRIENGDRLLTKEELKRFAKEIDLDSLYYDVIRLSLIDLKYSIINKDIKVSRSILDFFFYHDVFNLLDLDPLYILSNFLFYNFVFTDDAINRYKLCNTSSSYSNDDSFDSSNNLYVVQYNVDPKSIKKRENKWLKFFVDDVLIGYDYPYLDCNVDTNIYNLIDKFNSIYKVSKEIALKKYDKNKENEVVYKKFVLDNLDCYFVSKFSDDDLELPF